MKVVIIGAGLGGLALAQRLLDNGFDVQVYERDRAIEARFQGYRIGFGTEGLKALYGAVQPRLHPLLEAVSGRIERTGRAVDPQLNVLGEQERDDDEGRMHDPQRAATPADRRSRRAPALRPEARPLPQNVDAEATDARLGHLTVTGPWLPVPDPRRAVLDRVIAGAQSVRIDVLNA